MSATFHTPVNNVSTTVGTAYTHGFGSLVYVFQSGTQCGGYAGSGLTGGDPITGGIQNTVVAAGDLITIGINQNIGASQYLYGNPPLTWNLTIIEQVLW